MSGYPWGALILGVGVGAVAGDVITRGKKSVVIRGADHAIGLVRRPHKRLKK